MYRLLRGKATVQILISLWHQELAEVCSIYGYFFSILVTGRFIVRVRSQRVAKLGSGIALLVIKVSVNY